MFTRDSLSPVEYLRGESVPGDNLISKSQERDKQANKNEFKIIQGYGSHFFSGAFRRVSANLHLR
jgi:hypothetical protein